MSPKIQKIERISFQKSVYLKKKINNHYFQRGNQCQAFIAISDSTNQVIISFRGTNSGGQLLSEFGVGLEDYAAYTEIGRLHLALKLVVETMSYFRRFK